MTAQEQHRHHAIALLVDHEEKYSAELLELTEVGGMTTGDVEGDWEQGTRPCLLTATCDTVLPTPTLGLPLTNFPIHHTHSTGLPGSDDG